MGRTFYPSWRVLWEWLSEGASRGLGNEAVLGGEVPGEAEALVLEESRGVSLVGWKRQRAWLAGAISSESGAGAC